MQWDNMIHNMKYPGGPAYDSGLSIDINHRVLVRFGVELPHNARLPSLECCSASVGIELRPSSDSPIYLLLIPSSILCALYLVMGRIRNLPFFVPPLDFVPILPIPRSYRLDVMRTILVPPSPRPRGYSFPVPCAPLLSNDGYSFGIFLSP